jgi:hypothetical protein
LTPFAAPEAEPPNPREITTMETPNYRLTCGDLEDMDAGQLREHAVAYALKRRCTLSPDAYVEGIAAMIADRLNGDVADALDTIVEDACEARW